jgi:hypothetical protein
MPPAERLLEFRTLWMGSALTTTEIGSRFGTSRTSVRRYAARLGLPADRPLAPRRKPAEFPDLPPAEIWRRAAEVRRASLAAMRNKGTCLPAREVQ